MASWNILRKLSQKSSANHSSVSQTDINDLVMNISRGMPYNPTTEMDLALWNIAKAIQTDTHLLALLKDASAAEVNERYQNGSLPEEITKAVQQFIETYGGRGLGEIDLGSSRWAEDTTHVFEMLSGYLHITEQEKAPDAVFARSKQTAHESIAELVRLIAQTRHGWFKARLARFFAGRARQLMGMRENPKFFVVRLFWIIHRELLKSGRDFIETGELEKPDDLFYLSFPEIYDFSTGVKREWRKLISERRENNQREKSRRQIPRLLLSDGRAFYEGMQTDLDSENALIGSPVSPGSVQGRVRVVIDPRKANLKAGEIMVCPGTDPSWTPLFLTAGGLVMETGGMMTHGAVVAREYGIPAIVGVDHATQRLHSGQMIRINGSSGQIMLLDQE
jgi:pyruvate,water dikinase